ncbi:MAG: hypothetical protein MJ252_14835 [archaeon]|nr:hypothetical protein [archaeon]
MDATSKIYGYRVDNVHAETFRMLGGISRNKRDDDEEEGGEGKDGDEAKKEKKKRKTEGKSTLDDRSRLDFKKFDSDLKMDPFFKAMTATFADTKANALLVNCLPMSYNLDLLVEHSKGNDDEVLKDDKGEVLDINCGESFDDFNTQLKHMIGTFKDLNSADYLTKTNLAPWLDPFRESRFNENDSSTNNFLQIFKRNLEESHIMDETVNIDQDNDGNFGDPGNDAFNSQSGDPEQNGNNGNGNDDPGVDFPDPMDDGASIHSDSSQPSQDNPPMPDIPLMDQSTSFGRGIGNSLIGESSLTTEEITNYQKIFGTGSSEALKNTAEFQEFQKVFNKLNSNVKMKGVFKQPVKKTKKEETVFEITVENKVERSDVFGKKITKQPHGWSKESIVEGEHKSKVSKCSYNYNKYCLCNFFSWPYQKMHLLPFISNSNIPSNDVDNPVDPFDDNIGNDDDPFGPDPVPYDKDQVFPSSNNFAKFDQEYTKFFGELYKRFDIRKVKGQLWKTIDNLEEINPENKIQFQNIVDGLCHSMNKAELSGVSSSTLFVCMLHLANEKGKK